MIENPSYINIAVSYYGRYSLDYRAEDLSSWLRFFVIFLNASIFCTLQWGMTVSFRNLANLFVMVVTGKICAVYGIGTVEKV